MANTFIFDDDEQQPDANATLQVPGTDEQQPQGEGGGENNNRTFLIVAIALGGIVLLSFICMAVYAIVFLPAQRANAKATSDANQAAVALATNVAMETQAALLFTATPEPTEPPTAAPTETLVVVFATPTVQVPPTSEPATATFEAMQTQVANNMLTAAATSAAEASVTPTAGKGTKVALAPAVSGPDATSTAAMVATQIAQGTPAAAITQQLAKTGFADEVGLPGMFALTVILIAVILLARRMRQSPIAS